jgi:spore cortex biosynthesis protein YabQ
MSAQAVIFLSTAAIGFALGFFYDIFRVLRRAVAHGDIATQAEDIGFWLAASVFMFYILMYVTDGELRAFHLLGAALGMALYFAALSVIIVPLSLKVIGIMSLALTVLTNILLTPFILARKLILIPLKLLRPPAVKFGRRAKNNLYKCRKYVKMKSRRVMHEMRIIIKKT